MSDNPGYGMLPEQTPAIHDVAVKSGEHAELTPAPSAASIGALAARNVDATEGVGADREPLSQMGGGVQDCIGRSALTKMEGANSNTKDTHRVRRRNRDRGVGASAVSTEVDDADKTHNATQASAQTIDDFIKAHSGRFKKLTFFDERLRPLANDKEAHDRPSDILRQNPLFVCWYNSAMIAWNEPGRRSLEWLMPAVEKALGQMFLKYHGKGFTPRSFIVAVENIKKDDPSRGSFFHIGATENIVQLLQHHPRVDFISESNKAGEAPFTKIRFNPDRETLDKLLTTRIHTLIEGPAACYPIKYFRYFYPDTEGSQADSRITTRLRAEPDILFGGDSECVIVGSDEAERRDLLDLCKIAYSKVLYYIEEEGCESVYFTKLHDVMEEYCIEHGLDYPRMAITMFTLSHKKLTKACKPPYDPENVRLILRRSRAEKKRARERTGIDAKKTAKPTSTAFERLIANRDEEFKAQAETIRTIVTKLVDMQITDGAVSMSLDRFISLVKAAIDIDNPSLQEVLDCCLESYRRDGDDAFLYFKRLPEEQNHLKPGGRLIGDVGKLAAKAVKASNVNLSPSQGTRSRFKKQNNL